MATKEKQTITKDDVGKVETFADELNLPAPPAATGEALATGPSEAGGFDVAEIPADIAETIPDAPEALPKGISEFRLDSFQKKRSNETSPGAGDGKPYFNLKWVCQTEPHTGRMIFDMIPWVDGATVRDAADLNSPTMLQSRQELKDRLWKFKQLTKAAGWSNSGGMKPEEFFAANPVVKIDHGQKERQQKGPVVAGKQTYVACDPPQFDAKVNKYLPLNG